MGTTMNRPGYFAGLVPVVSPVGEPVGRASGVVGDLLPPREACRPSYSGGRPGSHEQPPTSARFTPAAAPGTKTPRAQMRPGAAAPR